MMNYLLSNYNNHHFEEKEDNICNYGGRPTPREAFEYKE
jgi:hypothetical protein